MPLRIEPHSKELPFAGGRIVVEDRNQLVQMVARLILGQYLHVELVLRGQGAQQPKVTKGMVDTAARRLAEPATDEARWHRDGWVFQMISWLASRAESTSRVLSLPHMQPHKQGLDCLYLDDVASKSLSLVVCEDKATKNPRKVILE